MKNILIFCLFIAFGFSYSESNKKQTEIKELKEFVILQDSLINVIQESNRLYINAALNCK